jgi:hypothetical protein
MSNYKPMSVLLLRCLMQHGGRASKETIRARGKGGRMFREGVPALGDLVEVRRERPWRKQRNRWRTVVYLTGKGWAACRALNPSWTPTRLQPELLKAWLAELVEERDPWAISLHEMPPKQFYKMQADAKELARLKEAKWIRPPLRRFGPKPGIQPANGFQRRDGSSPAPGQPVPPAAPAVPKMTIELVPST